jgi:hypothetical protein
LRLMALRETPTVSATCGNTCLIFACRNTAQKGAHVLAEAAILALLVPI